MLLKVHYSFSSLIHSEMPFVDPATCSGLEQHRITSSLPQGVRDPRHLLPLGHTPGCPLLSSLGPWSGTQGLPKMFLGFHLQKGRAQHQSLWELNFGIVSTVWWWIWWEIRYFSKYILQVFEIFLPSFICFIKFDLLYLNLAQFAVSAVHSVKERMLWIETDEALPSNRDEHRW